MNMTTAFGAIEVLGLAGTLLVGCSRSPQGTTDAGLLRGTVTYRERVALPPEAVVVVRLSDVSRQNVAAPVIAATRVPSEGRQVPLPFELRYDPKRISFDPLASTRLACAEPIGNQESRDLEALQRAERFVLDGATLSIHSKGMEKPLRFSRVTR
jgi:hypothetical protein